MTYFPPYESDGLNAHLRSFFEHQRGISVRPEPQGLRNIAVVGGLVTLKDQLYGKDLSRLNFTLGRLSEAGFPLHPEARFFVFDLSNTDKFMRIGSDFRAASNRDFQPGSHEPDHYDLALFSYVCNYAYRPGEDDKYSVSPSQKAPDQDKTAWADAATHRNTRVVVTYGELEKEVNTEQFKNPEKYRVLIHTSAGFDRHRPLTSFGSYGYAIQSQELPNMRRHAVQKTPVGDAILRFCKS